MKIKIQLMKIIKYMKIYIIKIKKMILLIQKKIILALLKLFYMNNIFFLNLLNFKGIILL